MKVRNIKITWKGEPVTVEACVWHAHEPDVPDRVHIYNMTFDNVRDARGQPVTKTFDAPVENYNGEGVTKPVAFHQFSIPERQELYRLVRIAHERLCLR